MANKMLILTAFSVDESTDPARLVFEFKGAERDVPQSVPSEAAGRGKRKASLGVNQTDPLYDLGAVVELPKVVDVGLAHPFVAALAREGLTIPLDGVTYYHWWRAFVPVAQGGALVDQGEAPAEEPADLEEAPEGHDGAEEEEREDRERQEDGEHFETHRKEMEAQARADVELIQAALYVTLHPIGQVVSEAVARSVIETAAGIDDLPEDRWAECLAQGATVWSVTKNGLKFSKAMLAEAKARIEAAEKAVEAEKAKPPTAAQKKKAAKQEAERVAAEEAAVKLAEEEAAAKLVADGEKRLAEAAASKAEKAAEKERIKAEKAAEKQAAAEKKAEEKRQKALEAMAPKGKPEPKDEEELPPEPPAGPVVEPPVATKPKGMGPKAAPPEVEVSDPPTSTGIPVRYPKHFYPGRVLRSVIRHAGAWGTCEYHVTCEVRDDKCGFTLTHFQGARTDMKVGTFFPTSRALFVAMTGRPRPRTVIDRVFDLDASDPLPE